MFLTPWYAHVRICAYQGVSTTSFLENLAFVLNERSLTMSFKPHNTYLSTLLPTERRHFSHTDFYFHQKFLKILYLSSNQELADFKVSANLSRGKVDIKLLLSFVPNYRGGEREGVE